MALDTPNFAVGTSIQAVACAGVSFLKVPARREQYLKPTDDQRLMREITASPGLETRILQLLLFTGASKNEILQARGEYM